jgi:hypothetical protein
VEVGARDGLQNIPGKVVPTHIKLELIERLIHSGVKVLEVGSFVRPDRVPQVSDFSGWKLIKNRWPTRKNFFLGYVTCGSKRGWDVIYMLQSWCQT